MTAIDRYLALVAKRLLLRRQARLDTLEEMRAHLVALEAQRGAPFADATHAATAFGEPRALARRINATVPWNKARMPVTLLLSGPLAMAMLGTAMAPVDYWIVPRLNTHPLVGPALLACLIGVTWLVYAIGPATSMLYGIRLGARPSHCRIAILLPCAVFTGSLASQWLYHDPGDIRNRLNEVVGLLGYGGISVLFCMLSSSWASIARIRVALPLVACAAGSAMAVISGLPYDAMTYAPAIGSTLGALLLASLLPWLARREPEQPLPA